MEHVLERVNEEFQNVHNLKQTAGQGTTRDLTHCLETGLGTAMPLRTLHVGILIVVIIAACGLIFFAALRGPGERNAGPSVKASAAGEPNSGANRVSQVGLASWYSLPSKTANGEQMDANELTAAHPSLPFGTEVEVENLDNGRKATVRVNDRGPFVPDRIIDVSKAAAKTLGMIVNGTATVRIRPQPKSTE